MIFNGVPDFLYETEVLRLDRALWFSPDGQTLMYTTYNDSLVQQHKYSWYGLDQQEPPAYPSIKTLRYPKVRTCFTSKLHKISEKLMASVYFSIVLWYPVKKLTKREPGDKGYTYR